MQSSKWGKSPVCCYSLQKSIMVWVLDNTVGVKGLKRALLTGTVHLVALVLACCPAVALPGHWDTLHLPTAAGKLPGAAALLWNTTRGRVVKPACDWGIFQNKRKTSNVHQRTERGHMSFHGRFKNKRSQMMMTWKFGLWNKLRVWRWQGANKGNLSQIKPG